MTDLSDARLEARQDHAARIRWNGAARKWCVECADCRWDSGASDTLAGAIGEFCTDHGIVAALVPGGDPL